MDITSAFMSTICCLLLASIFIVIIFVAKIKGPKPNPASNELNSALNKPIPDIYKPAPVVYKPIPVLENVKTPSSIRELAKMDYLNARGTNHLYMLRQGCEELSKQIKDYDVQINNNQQDIVQLTKERQEKIKLVLERTIAYKHLTEVPELAFN